MQQSVVITLAAAFALMSLGLPAEADPRPTRVPGQTQGQLKDKCDAAGGSFATEDWGGYSCQAPSGWAVNCYNDQTCFSWCSNDPKKCGRAVPGGNKVTATPGSGPIVGPAGANGRNNLPIAGNATVNTIGAAATGSSKTGVNAAPAFQSAPMSATTAKTNLGTTSGGVQRSSGGANRLRPF
jgi:hypothetical protein